MPFKKPTKIQFGGLELQLQLTGRNVINIEGRLNESMVGLFINSEGGFKLPPANKLLIVLQGANITHGVTDQKIADAFDKYVESGHTTMELMGTVQNLLDASGFLGKKTDDKEETEKQDSGKIVSLDTVEAPADSPLA